MQDNGSQSNKEQAVRFNKTIKYGQNGTQLNKEQTVSMDKMGHN